MRENRKVLNSILKFPINIETAVSVFIPGSLPGVRYQQPGGHAGRGFAIARRRKPDAGHYA